MHVCVLYLQNEMHVVQFCGGSSEIAQTKYSHRTSLYVSDTLPLIQFCVQSHQKNKYIGCSFLTLFENIPFTFHLTILYWGFK